MAAHFDTQRTFELIGRIYDSAFRPEQWDATLAEAAGLLGASGGVVFLNDSQAKQVEFGGSAGFDEAAHRNYREYYAGCDFAMQAALRRAPGGTIEDCAVSARELEASEFYNDFWKPLNIRHGLASLPLNDQSRQLCVGFYRAASQGAFDADEVACFEVLKPHFLRAAQLFRQFSYLEDFAGATAASLDRLPLGVVLIDGEGCVVAMNQAAGRLVARNDGVTYAGGRLAATAPEFSARLQDLVRQTVGTGSGAGFSPGDVIGLPRPSRRRALSVTVAPLGRGTPWPEIDPRHAPAAVVLLRDPDELESTPAELLARAYGLSPGEAALATYLALGRSLKEAAEQLDTSLGAARKLRAEVYRKTASQNQPDLVRLFLRISRKLEH